MIIRYVVCKDRAGPEGIILDWDAAEHNSIFGTRMFGASDCVWIVPGTVTE